MKFLAIIEEGYIMKEFLNTFLTLSKLSKECIMTITSNNVYFVVNEESSCSAPFVWINIDCKSFFNFYVMSGISDKYPDIMLSFNPSNIAKALAILRNAVNVCKIKLTNKQFPCLTFEIELPSNYNEQKRCVVHDVPVNLIQTHDWDLYKLPNISQPQIVLSMPGLRFLRNLIDKFKNFTPSVIFCATSKGELSIISESNQSTITSHYRNLKLISLNKERTNDDNDSGTSTITEISCLVDCKKTASFLSALQFSNAELYFGIIRDHMICITVKFNIGLNMICIIPSVYT